MRIYSIVSAVIGGVLMAGASTTALAGSCGGYVACNSSFNAGTLPYYNVPSATCNAQPRMGMASAQNCNPSIAVYPGRVEPLAPVNTYINVPYGYGGNFIYKNTPNVNITRVRSQGPMVNLNNAPTGYAGGCNPVTTGYCRSGGQMRAPMPMMQRPVMRAPVQMVMPVAPAQVRVGSGYSPANFAPRQYGNNVLTPGTAHIPTSIVDRSPITHIDGVPQQRVSSVTTVNGTYGRGYNTARSVMAPRPHMVSSMASNMRPVRGHGNVLGYVNGGSRTIMQPGTPDYWEKTSGATVVDGLPATQILCRRAGTSGTRRTVNVVRPVIGVPTPVPTAVPVRMRPVCAPVPMAMRPRMQAPMRAPMPAQMNGGRWTY